MTVPGIDVSKWQGKIDWRKAAGKGVRFAFVRAGSANSLGPYEDSRFVENVNGAHEAGIKVGIYWFVKPGYDIGAQADFYIALLRSIQYDIWPVADIEDYAGLSSTVMRTRSLLFLASVAGAMGTCGVYTAPAWWDSHVARSSAFAQYPLWVAHWGVSKPRLPLDWKAWVFWQTHVGEDGVEYGMESTGLDHDVYNGDVEQFEQEFGGGSTPPPPGMPDQFTGTSRVDIGGVIYTAEITYTRVIE